jgi:hypothetical protein
VAGSGELVSPLGLDPLGVSEVDGGGGKIADGAVEPLVDVPVDDLAARPGRLGVGFELVLVERLTQGAQDPRPKRSRPG